MFLCARLFRPERLREPGNDQMLTIFTTGKPFRGHSAVIQRNALKSWTLLHPDIEVILFGDEEGAADTALELGIRHVPHVERTPTGTKLLRSFFDQAQQIARHAVLCYSNCDIIFTSDLVDAVVSLRPAGNRFLMVGRRWDADVEEPLPFKEPDWADRVRGFVIKHGKRASGGWIDYFVFPKGFYMNQLPDLVIGRVFWDQWLVWRARRSGATVVDASPAVLAIHQNHNYGYHPSGRRGLWTDEQSIRNLELAGGRWHLCTIDDATHLLGPQGLRSNPDRNKQVLSRLVRTAREVIWFGALNWSRPVRKVLGLRKDNRDAIFARLRRFLNR
jgi:hypothetical protein